MFIYITVATNEDDPKETYPVAAHVVPEDADRQVCQLQDMTSWRGFSFEVLPIILQGAGGDGEE